jgi:hypothetical protein
MKTLNHSMVVEAALAGLFAATLVGPAIAQDAKKDDAVKDKPMPMKKDAGAKKGAEKVHCFGINSCKGKSECAVDGKSQCNGQNACKGQGWTSLSRKACAKQKGTVLGEKAAPAPAAPATPAAPAGK